MAASQDSPALVPPRKRRSILVDRLKCEGGFMRAVVTGGAGFLGSHLCDRLISVGRDVLALDNLVTGVDSNGAHLLEHPKFGIQRADVSKHIEGPGTRHCRPA